ncbi:MAG: PTS sugar transporter subunit IIC/EAL domain-containing protein [Betaproteobacteria bacterium]|nr:EAL domain-containing protein [Betaproteobacteria bacterium]MBU6512369.1 EAL domain-containing protein [Betaproteobacteria bacterium]MDE1954357.1 PTS sugar transporter subunit IIC/EAL domain-containing protein [Betaproteobacteria bacterium]MDE2152338.1 PTS sugar transporter subunit IIC/EAL domain-containing protein [Betaproteobacteria bacterium]MDE2477551.1 PTS sugar transporter subunit IIC/EAL domain-containing protein [Betaproteobacteria bacterium]
MVLQRAHAWLMAARDGFVALLPLTFLRVLAVLASSFPLAAYQQAMSRAFGAGWHQHLDHANLAFLGIFGIALCAVTAVQLAYRLPVPAGLGGRQPPLMVAVCAVVNFVVVSAVVNDGAVNFGFGSMLMGLAVGVATAELLHLAERWRLMDLVRLPYDTDASLYHALRLGPPMVLIGLLMFAAAQAWMHLPGLGAHPLGPLAAWAQAREAGVWVLSVAAALINQLLWFVGLHGSMAMDAYASRDLFAPDGAAYAAAMAWRPMFNGFVMLGGSGATLGLLLAIAIGSRDRAQRGIAKLALLPSLFNINDILLYGLPLVLNPVYLLPFLGVPVLLSLLAVGAVQGGWVHMQDPGFVWTTPALLSGWLLTGSWRGVALQVLEIALGTACYLPFVRRADARLRQARARAFESAKREILGGELPASAWHGQSRMIARGLLDDLRAALAGDQLWLAFQPMHDRAGWAIGAEALLRWDHPRHGSVPPALIVRLAEQSGDMLRLGRWVLERACAAKARWNEAGHRGLSMAVNLSPLQLTDPLLARHLQRCLDRYGLDPAEIELEITETLALPDGQAVDGVLGELEATGVRLAIDDFGMGSSSLLYLRRFEVHAIKIDGSLTRDLLDNPTNADIIRTIVMLGRARDVQVVAEFVETVQQRRALEAMGCDVFQGWYHSAPLDEARCIDYFSASAERMRDAGVPSQQDMSVELLR